MARKFMSLQLTTALIGLALSPASAVAQEAIEQQSEHSSHEHTLRVTQDYDPRPAIWRIADDDTTIYLFGTFHILPEGFRWRTPAFDTIIKQADELVLELTQDNLDQATVQPAVDELTLLMTNRPPTSANLTPTNVEKWRSLAEYAGVDYGSFDSLPAFLAMVMLSIGHLEDLGSSEIYGVEPSLEQEFRQRNRPILTIEDSVAVLNKVLKLDEQVLIAELDQQLTQWDGKDLNELIYGPATIFGGAPSPDEAFVTEHAWAKGEGVGELDWGDSEMSDALRQILFTERNNAWADWLDNRMDRKGNVLVAVGAAHFEGDGSVIALLQQRGIAVERVQ